MLTKRIIRVIMIALMFLAFRKLLLKTLSFDDDFKNSILIVILTNETNILTRGIAIWNTWAKEVKNHVVYACNCTNIMNAKKLSEKSFVLPNDLEIFREALELPILNLKIKDCEKQMGRKVFSALEESYKLYKSNRYNWYLMVDDDSYVFANNLNEFIKTKNTSVALSYGFKFKHYYKPKGFIGGGSGILLTNESMTRIVNKINKNECDFYLDNHGDVSFGGCAIAAGIETGNSNDENDKPRFNYFDPLIHYNGPLPSQLYELGEHKKIIGRECCSPKSISFHYITPNRMYQIYFNKTILKDLFQ